MRTIRKAIPTLLLGLTALALLTRPVGAQIFLGGQLSYDDDIARGSWAIGARAGIDIPLVGLTILATGDFYMPDCGIQECDFQDASLNLVYRLPIPLLISPYFGAGVAVQNTEGKSSMLGDLSDYGVSVLAGAVLKGPTFSRFQPFGEVRYVLMQDFDNQRIVSFGILFRPFL